MWYVYVLESQKRRGEIYVGSTNDLRRRFREHNDGKSPSTDRYRPWVLMYYEAYRTEELARSREHRLKHNGNAIRELKKRIELDSPSTTFLQKSGAGFTLFELIIVIAIFLLISGMLLVNFRRSRQGDIVRIAALRFATDVQRMQSTALAGGAEDRLAVAYGVHVDTAQPGRYILFGDRIRCSQDAQGAEVCTANGQYDAGANPAEELDDGVASLPPNVRIASVRTVAPDAVVPAIDVLFRPPRGTVTIAPIATPEVQVVLRHSDYDDTRTVSINRISGRVEVE
ncbi:GIY-YIG nuclease family protein [Candidatus Uhrbacteria bacterium]|nr:GIY-YIG nuclease family protein [Candidatus Uhrbacteria bacterium]